MILNFRDKRLRLPNESVADDEMEDLSNKLMEVFTRARDAVGLAAPQIGINKQAFVYASANGPKIMFNPLILERYGRVTESEGCLSVPKLRKNVARAAMIVIQYEDHTGKVCLETLKDFEARICQHECDHLKGKLILDK